MSTTTNMGITKWGASDHFSYSELATNWDKVDAHDHTSGKGVQIPTAGIANNAITSAKIVDGAIVNADINASADIDGSKLASASVPLSKLASWKSGLYSARPAAGTAGTFYRATDLNVVYFDNGTAWAPVPGMGLVPFCKAKQSGTANWLSAAAAVNPVPLDAEDYDEGTSTAQHDTVTNNSRVTIREAGVYRIEFGYTISAEGTGDGLYIAYITKNGSGGAVMSVDGDVAEFHAGPANYSQVRGALTARLAVSDYLEMTAQREGFGGTFTDIMSAAFLSARYIGP